MRKAILITATLALGLSATSFSQEKYVNSAMTAFTKTKDYDEAKSDIDKAMASPETMDKPKALWAKAQIYFALRDMPQYKDADMYGEVTKALLKLAELKPDYEKEDVDIMFYNLVGYYYNGALKEFYVDTTNPNHFTLAGDMMKNVIKIGTVNGGKRFEKLKKVDTIAAKAGMVVANSAYNSGKYEEAIPLLVAVKNNPITKTPAAYEALMNAYEKTKQTTEEQAVLQEGRQAFPNDQMLRNDELNYYIVAGKQDELVNKLQQEVAKDPKNGELQIILASTYMGIANPKKGDKPANSEEYITKAEGAFRSALDASPDNADYNYLFGALYYTKAKDVNDQINSITGTSAADNARYDKLKTVRDGLFEKALPLIEKSYNLLDAKSKAGTLKDGDKPIYISSMQALSQIYLVQNKLDKVKEIKTKMAATK